MAESLIAPSAVDSPVPLLEEAVRLLRRAPLSTWVCHFIGNAAFALAVLRFWSDVSNPRTTEAAWALHSLVLALLLVWMNSWRSVFAGRLCRQLSGSPETPWTARRLWYLLAGQAFLCGTRLVLFPIACLALFPLPATVAFYRYGAALGDRGDLDPVQLVTRARQLAARRISQDAILIPLLVFFQLILGVNLAVVLGVLPQIIRILTGYESAFSRSGVYFVSNALFVLLVFAVSWMAFDPFIQAVYCVRCFRGESLETGEDLRAALRSIRHAARPAAVILLFLVIRAASFAAVPPAQLDRSVRHTMESHEYDWRLPPSAASPARTSWLSSLADRMIAGVKAVSRGIRSALDQLFRWLTNSATPRPQGGALPVTSLHWSIYVLIGAVVLATLGIAWKKRRTRRIRPARVEAATVAIRLDAEDLTPDRLPEDRWLELAEQCLRDQDLRLALRAFYLANLAWLGAREFITIHPGKTNREYQLEFERKTRGIPLTREPFAAGVTAFERAWYGMHEVSAADIADFRARMQTIKTALSAPRGAAA